MITTKKAELMISWILTFGTLFSAVIVIFGGCWYLTQNGHINFQTELSQATPFKSLPAVMQAAIAGSPAGIIELGVLLLVATQLLRVGLLVGFYALIRDYKFTVISLFVFIILLYTFLYAH